MMLRNVPGGNPIRLLSRLSGQSAELLSNRVICPFWVVGPYVRFVAVVSMGQRNTLFWAQLTEVW